MDFIFRFLRWKAANAVWNAGARELRRKAHAAPPPTAKQEEWGGQLWAFTLTLLVLPVIFVVLAAIFG